MTRKLLISLFLCFAAWSVRAEKPHAVFVIGTTHYAPQQSMPPLAKELERHGFRTTVLMPPGEPELNKNKVGIPGLEVLEDADLAIFFLRFLTLDDEQFAHIEAYVKSGKPVVGFRTSTHAFKYAKGHPREKWNLDFGRYVLGTKYIVHQSGPTDCELVKGSKNPVLSNLSTEPFVSPGTLYLTSLQPGCDPLVLGTGYRKGTRLSKSAFGTFFFQEKETDIVAWTWENKWGGKVFCSSFGHVGDFKVPAIMRIIVNGICWAGGVDVPAAEAEIATFELVDAKRQKKKPKPKQ